MAQDFNRYNDLADILKALAHPVRLCIVAGILGKGKCNVTYMQNCLELPQSTISQHLQKLKAAKIIKGERDGLEINYRVCNEFVINLIETMFTGEEKGFE